MYQTSFGCLFFMALFSLKSFADFLSQNIMVRTPLLDTLALRVFDVLILQAIYVIVVAFVLLRALRLQGAPWANKYYSVVYVAAFITIMLLFEVVLEKYVLKPTFSFNRPGDTIGEPWFTQFLRHYYEHDYKQGSSTPSGFIVRQTMLTLLFIFAMYQPKFLNPGKWGVEALLHVVNASVLLFMAWLRLYTGAHRLYDVAIAIGAGGFLFWAMIFTFFSFKNDIRSRIGDFALPALTFSFMILLYSQHFIRWMLFCGTIVGALTIIFRPISAAPSCKPKV